jgi:tricorn protease
MPGDSAGTLYRFSALQTVNNPGKQAEVFDQCWRIMRDNWYDERLNNRDWTSIRAKYLPIAATSPDMDAVAQVVNMMLGELNGSHLAFSITGGSPPSRRGAQPAEDPNSTSWKVATPHFGLRFDPVFEGPGLLVRDVIPGSPASLVQSRIFPGEVIIRIDGKTLTRGMDFAAVLNGPLARDITLLVRNKEGNERNVVLRPISFSTARTLLYDKWLMDNEVLVHKLGQGKLGYLHISAMDMPSFHKFEEKLAAAGLDRDGLIIDVRENGGGSTADLLLTSLTQPGHSITVPREGKPGYPHDRLIFPRWDKPITVLCNQNSFSNAEIFSHAIKHLKRGKIVGVTTAGGVISTGGTSIMDVGFLRLPFRGWYLPDNGQDLELNGAVPDYIVWPQPGDLPSGKDAQMEKAVEVLRKEVEQYLARPKPKLIKASERGD